MSGCTTCQHAQWERTAAGRIKRNTSGRCTLPKADIDAVIAALLACVNVTIHRWVVWPGDGQGCYHRKPQPAMTKPLA